MADADPNYSPQTYNDAPGVTNTPADHDPNYQGVSQAAQLEDPGLMQALAPLFAAHTPTPTPITGGTPESDPNPLAVTFLGRQNSTGTASGIGDILGGYAGENLCPTNK